VTVARKPFISFQKTMTLARTHRIVIAVTAAGHLKENLNTARFAAKSYKPNLV
jgi:hypothetical protein